MSKTFHTHTHCCHIDLLKWLWQDFWFNMCPSRRYLSTIWTAIPSKTWVTAQEQWGGTLEFSATSALTECNFLHLSNSGTVTLIWKCHQSLQRSNSEQRESKRVNSVQIVNSNRRPNKIFLCSCFPLLFCCCRVRVISPSYQSNQTIS